MPLLRSTWNKGGHAIDERRSQAAGGNAAKRLTANDPLPQTVFRLAVKTGKPMMVKLPLKITR